MQEKCKRGSFHTLDAQALEGGTSDSAGMGPAFELQAGHLGPGDAAFFRHWHRLLELEEGGSSARRADIWRLSGAR